MLFRSMLFAVASASAASDPYASVRGEFNRAFAQATSSSASVRHSDSDALRAYPLYSYVQAARIRSSLANAGPEIGPADQRAQTFVAYYEGEPVGRDLHKAWLASLADRQLWQTYVLQYRPELADDVLQCHHYSARIVLNQTDGLAEEIRARWLTPKSLPECEQAFEWLRAQNQLS